MAVLLLGLAGAACGTRRPGSASAKAPKRQSAKAPQRRSSVRGNGCAGGGAPAQAIGSYLTLILTLTQAAVYLRKP